MISRREPSAPSQALRGHVSTMVVLLVAVLLAHAWLLAGLPAVAGAGGKATAATLRVRHLVQPARPEPVLPPPASPVPALRPTTDRPSAAPPAPPVAAAVPATVPPPALEAPPADVGAASTASLDAADLGSRAVAAPASMAAAASVPLDAPPETPSAAVPADAVASEPPPVGGEPPPVYATRLPPAALLRYALRRGLLSGQGRLSWRPAAEGYELEIDGTAFGLPLLSWASRGGIDAAGLAPERFVDRRRGREVRAANFQRDKAVISWSGVTTLTPLLAGAQDRLSWMVQLASVVAADPARWQAGERVLMQVAGARGDADVWAFAVVGHEAVDVVGGRIDSTLALRREPRKPFDTQVEVWLDPAHHHLPVRLKLSTAGGGESLEFVLQP